MSDPNPFAAPDHAGSAAPVADVPAAIHDQRSIMLAAFLGGFLGGALILYQNEKALGRANPTTMLIGLAGALLVVILAIVLPEGVPGIVFTMATVFGCRAWAEKLQGPELARAQEAGTPHPSRWGVAGWSLLMLVPTLLLFLLVTLPYVLLTEG